jgi:uncharacterized protein (DUF2336 family)
MPSDINAHLRDLAASSEAKPKEMRPVLLRVATDLFALHKSHNAEEIRLYEEMAGRLIDDSDEATLANVARRLVRCADAPPSLLKRIRARGGEPARELLMSDPRLEWRDLRQIAAGGPCDQARAIASREDLDREIARLLASRPEREILRALALNTRAPLAVEDLRLLAGRGRDDTILARALLDRGDPTIDHLPLYLAANPRERSRLVALALEANLAQAAIPSAGAKLDETVLAQIEDAAARGKHARLALILADRLACDSLYVRRILGDESGDAASIAFAAIGLPSKAAVRVLLAAFPKVALSPEALARDLRLVKNVPQRVASRMIDAMAGAPRGGSFRNGTVRPKTGAARPQTKQTRRFRIKDKFRADIR